MNDLAIQVKNLTKTFKIYDRATDRLRQALNFLRKKNFYTNFSAIEDISFEIKKGTFLGVVGKNGAGKSTLLKILSGELSPSSGEVKINGRVALLQLGVGFDPELPGRENIRYSCRILGFSDSEISAIEQKAIDFADIGSFIDHPVRTYSSGMYSRLAFAVGINVDPDVLIADEVLAVGDMQFSQKCIRKMREFKQRGKTVVLVTHDTNTVSAFCDQAIWIKDGKLFRSGSAFDIAEQFRNFMLYDELPKTSAPNLNRNHAQTISKFESLHELNWRSLLGSKEIIGNLGAIIENVVVTDVDLQPIQRLSGNEEINVLLKISANKDIKDLYCGFLLNDSYGLPAVHLNTEFCDANLGQVRVGESKILSFKLKLPGIKNGKYAFDFSLQDRANDYELLFRIHSALVLEVERRDQFANCTGHVIVEHAEAKYLD